MPCCRSTAMLTHGTRLPEKREIRLPPIRKFPFIFYYGKVQRLGYSVLQSPVYTDPFRV